MAEHTETTNKLLDTQELLPAKLSHGRSSSGSLLKRLWDSRNRISTLLVVYFVGGALFMLAASVLVFLFFWFLAGKLNEVNDENVPQLITAFQVAQESAELASSLPRLTTSTQADFNEIVASVNETEMTFELLLELISRTESGDMHAEKLLDSGELIRSNIEEVITLVSERFELMNTTDQILADMNRLQGELRASLDQVLDDQLFYAMTGYRSLSDGPMENQEVDATAFDTYRHLSEIESAFESAAELLAAVFNETDSDQIVPLLEQFEASKTKSLRYAQLLSEAIDVSQTLALLEDLYALGEGENGGFVTRENILDLREREAQLIVENRQLVQELYLSGEALVAAASDATNAATETAEQANTLAVYFLVALNIVGIVGAVLLIWLFVVRIVARRLETLADRMYTMAEGDLEVEVPTDARKDEINEMAEALEVFRKHSLEALRLNEVERLNSELAQSNDQLESINQELKNAQAQIVMREKLAAMGELTAGVAHEIKNPLNFMMNFAEVSQELIDELFEEINMEPDERDDELIQELKEDLLGNLVRIRDHGTRANSIVRDMLAMGRESNDWVPTSVNRLLSEHARLAFHSARAADSNFQLDIKEELDEELPEIQAIQNDLGRVFLNMFMNACYATDKRRSQLEEGEFYDPTLTVRSRIKDETHIEVQIEDNGVGIPQEEIEKIFQPFFTTKPTDQGTGLGLALAADIIRAHGGHVNVESVVKEFTRMSIELPIAQSEGVQDSGVP